MWSYRFAQDPSISLPPLHPPVHLRTPRSQLGHGLRHPLPRASVAQLSGAASPLKGSHAAGNESTMQINLPKTNQLFVSLQSSHQHVRSHQTLPKPAARETGEDKLSRVAVPIAPKPGHHPKPRRQHMLLPPPDLHLASVTCL